jgi:LacI family transcriptional regulator
VQALLTVEHIVWDAIYKQKKLPFLRDTLDEVLGKPSITAWVAENDAVALDCLAYLRRKSVRVPDRISLIGFDDTPAALFDGLTSYSYNPKAAVQRLVDIVLTSPAMLRRSRQRRAVELPGYVSERTSVKVIDR